MFGEQDFGDLIEVEAGFWHSSDLDPTKPINWKRKVAFCGEYGCMGDLGMHVLHLPLRLGLRPDNVRALLAKIVEERPGRDGQMEACETWDNAILACQSTLKGKNFPMLLSTKRIAPGHANTWFIRINGTRTSVEFSTKNPKQLAVMNYAPGDKSQSWCLQDVPYQSAYPTITGHIFEFGFSDAILQMWAAFCDGNRAWRQRAVRLRPAGGNRFSHALFTAALQSGQSGQTISVEAGA
jgi:hypothetical protein